MNKKILMGGILILFISSLSVFYVLKNVKPENTETPERYACTMEAKMCPDGSYVGRSGPKCEFAECPSPTQTKATVKTTLGQVMTGLNVSITPKEIISDSRCPIDVQCIWAGTVEVKTTLSTQVSHGEHTLKLNEPRVFGNYTVTLTEVTPNPKAEIEIPDSSYRFTFEVKKN